MTSSPTAAVREHVEIGDGIEMFDFTDRAIGLKSPKGFVTIDIVARSYRYGLVITGPFETKPFIGRGWHKRLFEAAMSALESLE